jgi:hypothetical protein
MEWCFVSVAVGLVGLALAAMTVHGRHIRVLRFLRVHPVGMMRGCVAVLLVLVAIGFVGLAIVVGGG